MDIPILYCSLHVLSSAVCFQFTNNLVPLKFCHWHLNISDGFVTNMHSIVAFLVTCVSPQKSIDNLELPENNTVFQPLEPSYLWVHAEGFTHLWPLILQWSQWPGKFSLKFNIGILSEFSILKKLSISCYHFMIYLHLPYISTCMQILYRVFVHSSFMWLLSLN